MNETSGGDQFAEFGRVFAETFVFHPAAVGVVIALMGMVLLAIIFTNRRQDSVKLRGFVDYLKKWPQNTDHELYEMINFAHVIRLEHLEDYGVSRTVLHNFAEFHRRYHDAITHPFIYDRDRLLRAMAFIQPGMPVHIIEHEEEQLTAVDTTAGDVVTLRLIGWGVRQGQKIRLKFLGKGRLIRFKAKVLDPATAQVELYAYRSESQRHFARIRVESAVLILNPGKHQRELPVLDLSIKSFLCQATEAVPAGEIPAALRLPAAPLFRDFTVTKLKEVTPGQPVFVISHIAQKVQEALVQYVFDFQHRR